MTESWVYVPLSNGGTTEVDFEDRDIAKNFGPWSLSRGYARSSNHEKTTMLHRVILDAPSEVEVDHINRNKLDNKKSNLRLCTRTQNARNVGKKSIVATSKYKGVHLHLGKRWCAQIKIRGKSTNLGYFDSEEDAAKAYDAKALELFGEFAYLNFHKQEK